MIKVMCTSNETAQLVELVPFQGNLKRRTQEDIDALRDSILNEGLLMPFAVWDCDGKLHILDGHGRYEAIIKCALQDSTVLTQNLPIIKIVAEDELVARKALMQIVSVYGKIDKKGLQTFSANVADYKAPVLKHVSKPVAIKVEKPKTDKIIVRVKVPRDMVKQFTELLKQVEGIELY